MNLVKQVKPEEVSCVLRALIAGEISLSADDLNSMPKMNWWDVNEPSISIGGWSVQFFIEADWIYDIYDVAAPDGRESHFCPRDNDSDISLFLFDPEIARLIKILGGPITDDDIERFDAEA